MAIPIGNQTKAIVNKVKESLSKPGQPLYSKNNTDTNFSSLESPYVEMGDKTSMKFVYGVSEYGGDDVVSYFSPRRFSERYFLIID